MLKLSEDVIPPCKICGKVWQRKNFKKWYYYKGVVVCTGHKGAYEWLKDLYIKAQAEYEDLINH